MTMDMETFVGSLDAGTPPAGAGPLIVALWHGLRGEWDDAHNIAQDDDSADAAWVHAWLHRQEGDLPNASYWYRRAQKPVEKSKSFDEEGRIIAEAILRGLST
jgi:hypothetical protein